MRKPAARLACVLVAALLVFAGRADSLGHAKAEGRPLQESMQAHTRYVTSKDGTRIAYDVTGSGPVVMLLHGGYQDRNAWHERGYVDRLRQEFTVITVDQRGNGESDKPTTVRPYAIDRLREDILAVADTAGAKHFALWGFSYGANIGRYVASQSDRVSSMVYIGIPFGAAVAGAFRQMILDLRTKWVPIVEAERAGRLDLSSLSDVDRETWHGRNVPLNLAWLSAMLEYRPVEPRDMRCPTLWLVGSKNEAAMESADAYEDALPGTNVSLQLVDGFTHADEFDQIDRVFPFEIAFTRKHASH